VKKHLYRFLFIPSLFIGCHYYNHDLSFQNNTASPLSISYTNDTTASYANNIAYYISESAIIKPDSVLHVVKPGKKGAWLDYINQSDHKKLFIHIWNIDTLKKYTDFYTISDLKDSHKYIKSFSISKQQLMKPQLRIKIE
jgi:hypothetical protein